MFLQDRLLDVNSAYFGLWPASRYMQGFDPEFGKISCTPRQARRKLSWPSKC